MAVLCRLRLCSKVVFTDARPYSEPCTALSALMSGCFQNISCYMCCSKRNTFGTDELNFVCSSLCSKTWFKPTKPHTQCCFNAKFKSSFERKPKQIPPLSIRVSCDLKAVGFQKRNVLSSNIVSTPPWLLMRPVVNYSLHSADKVDIPAEIHKHRFYELCDQYEDCCSIYRTLTALKWANE